MKTIVRLLFLLGLAVAGSAYAMHPGLEDFVKAVRSADPVKTAQEVEKLKNKSCSTPAWMRKWLGVCWANPSDYYENNAAYKALDDMVDSCKNAQNCTDMLQAVQGGYDLRTAYDELVADNDQVEVNTWLSARYSKRVIEHPPFAQALAHTKVLDYTRLQALVKYALRDTWSDARLIPNQDSTEETLVRLTSNDYLLREFTKKHIEDKLDRSCRPLSQEAEPTDELLDRCIRLNALQAKIANLWQSNTRDTITLSKKAGSIKIK